MNTVMLRLRSSDLDVIEEIRDQLSLGPLKINDEVIVQDASKVDDDELQSLDPHIIDILVKVAEPFIVKGAKELAAYLVPKLKSHLINKSKKDLNPEKIDLTYQARDDT